MDADEVLKGVHHHSGSCRQLCTLLALCHGLRIYLEHGLVGVAKTPYQHQTNHHGVARLVVDLDGLGVEVASAEREFLGGDEGVHPVITGLCERTAVLAEEHHHTCLTWFQLHKTREGNEVEHKEHHTRDGRHSCHLDRISGNGIDNQKEADEEHENGEAKHHDTIEPRTVEFEFFCFHIK